MTDFTTNFTTCVDEIRQTIVWQKACQILFNFFLLLCLAYMLCIFFPRGKHKMSFLILQIVLTNCLAMFLVQRHKYILLGFVLRKKAAVFSLLRLVNCKLPIMSWTCCVISPDEYLSLGSFRASRGRSLDVMGIDESVILKVVNNGPLFCSVLFCRTSEARITNCGCHFIKLANLRIFVVFGEYLS